MQTSHYCPTDLTDLPISCTVCLCQEGVIASGWVWELSPSRCLVQSHLLASPGMVVVLSLQVPSTTRNRMEGLVTWARESEFGVELIHHALSMNEERVNL